MLSSLRRRKTLLASAILGAWVFGLFVGIAHACGWDGVTAMRHVAVAAGALAEPSPDGAPPGCAKFCNDDLPLVAKVQSVQDSPTGHPPVLAGHQAFGLATHAAPAVRPVMAAHPPPDVPVSIRFLRLTL